MEGVGAEGNINNNTAGLAVKKKRGRPRKSDTVLLPGEISALGINPTSEARSKKISLTSTGSAHAAQGSNPMVGQTVHGVIDGSFDAGFLITVRPENSDTIFRGVVFGPGLSLPLSGFTDIAPKVKITKRVETVVSTPISESHPENMKSEQEITETSEPAAVAEYTPPESGVTPENEPEEQQQGNIVETGHFPPNNKFNMAQ